MKRFILVGVIIFRNIKQLEQFWLNHNNWDYTKHGYWNQNEIFHSIASQKSETILIEAKPKL